MPIVVTDPYELLTLYQATLQGIDQLVELVGGDPAAIQLIDREGDLAAEIENLRPPALLLYWDGITPSRSPNRFRYLVGIVLRVKRPSRIFQALCEGVSTYSGSDGLPMLGSIIHPRFDPMDLPSCERLQIPVGDRSRVLECMVFKTGFADRGSH